MLFKVLKVAIVLIISLCTRGICLTNVKGDGNERKENPNNGKKIILPSGSELEKREEKLEAAAADYLKKLEEHQHRMNREPEADVVGKIKATLEQDEGNKEQGLFASIQAYISADNNNNLDNKREDTVSNQELYDQTEEAAMNEEDDDVDFREEPFEDDWESVLLESDMLRFGGSPDAPHDAHEISEHGTSLKPRDHQYSKIISRRKRSTEEFGELEEMVKNEGKSFIEKLKSLNEMEDDDDDYDDDDNWTEERSKHDGHWGHESEVRPRDGWNGETHVRAKHLNDDVSPMDDDDDDDDDNPMAEEFYLDDDLESGEMQEVIIPYAKLKDFEKELRKTVDS